MTVNSTTMTTVKRKLTGAMTVLKETISTRICMSTNVCSRTPSGRPTMMPIMDKMIFSRNTYAPVSLEWKPSTLMVAISLTRSVRLMLPRLNRTMNASAPAEMSTSATT